MRTARQRNLHNLDVTEKEHIFERFCPLNPLHCSLGVIFFCVGLMEEWVCFKITGRHEQMYDKARLGNGKAKNLGLREIAHQQIEVVDPILSVHYNMSLGLWRRVVILSGNLCHLRKGLSPMSWRTC